MSLSDHFLWKKIPCKFSHHATIPQSIVTQIALSHLCKTTVGSKSSAQVGKRAGFSPILKNISNYVQAWEAGTGYDIIAADLTINNEREETMDFSVPFMKLGNTILMRRPKELSYMFSFLHPFSSSTWLLLLGSYALTSSLLFITSRLDCPSPSLPACVWLPLASLLGQSTDYLPTSTAPRLLITAWWLFILLLVSAYTANMAAFLTVSRC